MLKRPLILLLCFLFLPASVLLSQQKHSTYFRINLGYGFGFAGGELGMNAESNSDSYRTEMMTGSIGGGGNFSVLGGYFPEKNLSLELGYQFMLSPRILFEKIEQPDYSSETNAMITSHYISFGSGLYIPLRNTELTLLSRFGVLLPVGRYFTMESNSSINYVQYAYSQATMQTEKFTVLFSPGFYASLSAVYPIGKKISVYGEVETRLACVTYKSSEIIQYKSVMIDGQNEYTTALYNLTTAEKYTNYLKEITNDDNIPTEPDFNEDEPTDELTRRLSASSVGINVGIIYTVRWKDMIHKTR